MIGMLKPYSIPLKNPPTPKELECLGFTLSDLSLDFKKGYMEMKCGYKTVTEPSDPETCEFFLETLRNGPGEVMGMADSFMSKNKDLFDQPAAPELPKKGSGKKDKKDRKRKEPKKEETPTEEETVVETNEVKPPVSEEL
jgi:hypothetical protein